MSGAAPVSEGPPVRDAAAILLLRPAPGPDPFEIFMVRRSGRAKFMADAMVFPGGRVEPADADPRVLARVDLTAGQAADRLGLPEDPARALAFFVAAARETFEEANLLPGVEDPAAIAALAPWRARMNAGEANLGDMLEALDLRLRLSALRRNSHWITPPIEKRRYDTWFFTARAPAGQTGAHDARETVASAWLGPRAALHAYEAGEIQLAPPTLRQLLSLRTCADVDAALELGAGTVPPAIQPQPLWVAGELHLTLPGDEAFDPPGAGRNRVVLRGGRFVSEGHPTA